MKKAILILAIFIGLTMISSCIKRYEATYQTHNCKGLYSNIYTVLYGGIYNGSNEWELYITDSVNFRIDLGTYNEDESYGCKISNDTLYIEKKTRALSQNGTILEERKFKLSGLKKTHKFD